MQYYAIFAPEIKVIQRALKISAFQWVFDWEMLVQVPFFFIYDVYKYMNKNMCLNRTWADLCSILPKAKYEEKMTISLV